MIRQNKRYYIIDQLLARHFKYNGECLSCPPPFLGSQMITPFLIQWSRPIRIQGCNFWNNLVIYLVQIQHHNLKRMMPELHLLMVPHETNYVSNINVKASKTSHAHLALFCAKNIADLMQIIVGTDPNPDYQLTDRTIDMINIDRQLIPSFWSHKTA